jgi:hypothetical protein
MQQERVMVGVVSERVVDERLVARKALMRGFALEVLDAQGADIYQLGAKIDKLHPVTRKHWWDSRNNATPKEVWQTLVELQLDDRSGSIKCETVMGKDKHGKPKARFLWSRTTEGNTPIHP